MTIQFLKKMQKKKVIANIFNEGMSDEEIKKLEIQVGQTFPKAYREFLYLGGIIANMLAESDNSVQGEEWRQTMENAEEELAEKNMTLNKPYWVFSSYGVDQFLFFYFDEGDDPPVYNYHGSTVDKAQIVMANKSLSDFINKCIDHRSEFGY